MTDEELRDALDGLYAYDSGCVDSGIKDEVLRQQVKQELANDLHGSEMFGKRLSRIAREMFLSDAAIEQGYGLEAMQSFIQWLDEHMLTQG